MKVAVASGKGGTGKTTVSLALAAAAESPCLLLDCDVEEPNCHLFTSAEPWRTEGVDVLVPEFLGDGCDGCGACVRSCRFNVLAGFGRKVMVFAEMCHSCGGCVLACPHGALREIPYSIGRLEFRHAEGFELISGVMKVGYAMAPPLIRQLKKHLPASGLALLDCPPGTSCSMVTSVRDCDFVVLVTEPTPFGLHDLRLAVDTLAELNLPCGVIVNRAEAGATLIHDYCQEAELPILLEIPLSRQIAETCSAGGGLLDACPDLKESLQALLAQTLPGLLAGRSVAS